MHEAAERCRLKSSYRFNATVAFIFTCGKSRHGCTYNMFYRVVRVVSRKYLCSSKITPVPDLENKQFDSFVLCYD